MFGFENGERFDLERLRSRVDPEDFARIEGEWRKAAVSGAEAEMQLHIRLPDGSARVLMARGRTQADASGKLTSIQGVVRDVTEQQRARLENEELRREVAHAGRVSMLGTLSSSLAHELSQPLAQQLGDRDDAYRIDDPDAVVKIHVLQPRRRCRANEHGDVRVRGGLIAP